MRKIIDLGKALLEESIEKLKEYSPLLEDLVRTPGRFQPELTARLYEGLYHTMYARYFRTEMLHPERLPPKNAILFGNHGGIVPYDALNVVVGIHHYNQTLTRPIIDGFFQKIPSINNLFSSIGGCRLDDAVALLNEGQKVLTFPGGMSDLNKSFFHRYKVDAREDFATGDYVRLAAKTNSPLVPVAIVGGEEAHVNVANLAPLAKLLKLPAFPLPLNPAPFPVKFFIDIGEPIMIDYSAQDLQDKKLMDYLTAEHRVRLERMIYDICRKRKGILGGLL